MKSENYLAFVRTLPCCHCGAPAVAHHVIGIGMGVMGRKASDIHSVPLCDGIGGCHAEVHKDPESWPQFKWVCETQLKAVKEGILNL